MKIIRNGNGSITVRFNGVFGLRQAILLPKLVSLFPATTPVKLDFTDAECDRESAVVALIPALASMRSRKLQVIGLERAAAFQEAFEEDIRQAA